MFAAILSRTASAPPSRLVDGEKLLAALAPFMEPDAKGQWHDDRGLIVQACWHNTQESRFENAPGQCRETGRVIASWARLDNRADLIATLSLRDYAELTDAQIILAAHKRWGSDCASHLEGDFSFIIYDPATRSAYCARDTMGAKPLFYLVTQTHIVVATSIAAIRSVPGLGLQPDQEWVALFASAFVISGEIAAYENVKKLPAAHALEFVAQARPEPKRYFEFRLAAPHAVTRSSQWVDEYREQFDRAVRVRARSAFLIGAESSAGLDSASIVASLPDFLPHRIEDFHTFAMISAEEEPEKLNELSTTSGVPPAHELVRPEMLGIDESFRRALTVNGHPPEHGQTLVYPDFFEQSQMLGIRTMMSGFGGDEVVTSYARHLIDELHSRGEYCAVFGEIEGALPARAIRFAKRILRGPDDPDAGLRALINRKIAIGCLRRDFVEDSGLRERIEAAMCRERSDYALNSLVGVDDASRALQSARLEASALYASTYGMEYRYPLLDRRLIQQFLSTPSIEKRRGSMGRYLHRRAMDGRIPDSICWQKTKSMGNLIGGMPALAPVNDFAFGDLPEPLRSILDRNAFEKSIQFARQSSGEYSNEVARTRYFLWLVNQLCVWLKQG